MTAGSSKALRTLEQALQLSTRFASAHDDLNQWLDGVETELNTVEPDASPAYQERQKVGGVGCSYDSYSFKNRLSDSNGSILLFVLIVFLWML